MIERDGGYVVVEDVGLNDSVEETAADEAEFTVDRSSCTTGKSPGLGVVVRKRWVGVLQVCDSD